MALSPRRKLIIQTLPSEPARSIGGVRRYHTKAGALTRAPAAPFAVPLNRHPPSPCIVIPAKAGIQTFAAGDSRLRGNDGVVLCGKTGWFCAGRRGDRKSVV